MKPDTNGQHVFIVDDDDAVRAGLDLLLRSAGHRPVGFSSADTFLSAYDATDAGCVIMDLRMPGTSGLVAQRLLKERDINIPVIFVSGHAGVTDTVAALRAGAVDVLEKPYNPQILLERVATALALDAKQRDTLDARAALTSRLQSLTPREHEVLQLVVAGKASKVIAYDLGISERTVELHRARGMKKMKMRNVAQLMHDMLEFQTESPGSTE